MTDRELLELAAKAAGYQIVGDVDRYVAQPDHFAGGLVIRNDRGGDSLFNPLTDDGDALRLAVKLNIYVMQNYDSEPHAIARVLNNLRTGYVELHCADSYAATRRAIVRAAAEIGKGMCPFPSADEIREFTGDDAEIGKGVA